MAPRLRSRQREHVGLVFFEPACPKLNPIVRVWEDLRGKLAGQSFAYLEWMQNELCAHIERCTDAAIQSLTVYP